MNWLLPSQVERSEQIYSAQAFAATRFGSTKLKTYQKRLLEDAQGDRASSGFVDDDELSDR
ncbi:hypothetical protein ANCDUO_11975 [Ancylostoma duodenale]|uniref:Uncharacterized protein n=1 Tax=Ancylostoma duodenale TaxID=51022 RepID=A0A0C2GA35_9BILA|nr:hypothetical protein ANCDUO_11975 [Ancylostoma duodenale]